MSQTQNQSPLHSDKRLSNMDPDRLSMLMAFAKELSEAPQNQKMAVFLSVQQRANQKQMSFSQEERSLLLQVLTEHMTPEEKKRMESLLKLASKLSPA